MTVPNTDDAVADALLDYHRRRALGEEPDVFEYRDRLGESHSDFLDVLETEAVLDQVLEPPPADPLPRVFGAYTLLRELGRGAVGVVYEAVHRDLGRRAALKVLKTGFDTDVEARERFRRETRACASVRHDHIVEIFEAGEVEGRPFYAMSLIEGRSLSSLIKAREVPEVHSLCRELGGVADALHALHQAGIVHRDVKPSNLMVRPDGRIFLADFGHARAGAGLGLSLTSTGDILGTPLYMSPEQMLGNRDEVDARSDIYALGATLYEAMAHQPVFQTTELATLAGMVLSQRPEPLRKVAPETPAPVEAIAMKALEKRKEDRYATAALMRDDLKAFAEDREVVGRPVGAVVRSLREARQRWIPIAASILAVVAGGWWWTHRSASLELTSIPDGAEVVIAGESLGTLPLHDRLSLAPGRYQVTLKAEGFEDRTRIIDLDPGASKELEIALFAKDPSDPVARARLAAAVGIQMAKVSMPDFSRSRAPGPPILLLWPRGDVRAEDLDSLAFELGADAPDLPAGSKLEFRRGDEVLGSVPFDEPKTIRPLIMSIPASVRDAVRAGDEITWGWWPASKKQGAKESGVKATFRKVPDEKGSELAKLEKRLEGQLGDEMRAQWLRAQGFKLAALLVADRVAQADPTNLAAQTLAYSLYEGLGLRASSRAADLEARISHFPPEAKAALDAEASAAPAGKGAPPQKSPGMDSDTERKGEGKPR